jgi:ATP-dependent DNA ligase
MKIEVQEHTCKLFKRDSKGKVREWEAMSGTDGTNWYSNWYWCTVSGLDDGKKVQSGWKIVEQKNIGKTNETSLQKQARAEMQAEFKKKKERGYFESLSNIDTFEKIKPMLAIKHEDTTYDFEKEVYYSQPKLDGIRCIARSDGLWSRAGKEIVAVPHIEEALKEFFEQYPDAILDGELYNHDLKDDFNKITSLVRKTKPTAEDIAEARQLVQYHTYDVVEVPEEVEDVLFIDRWKWLRSQKFNTFVKVVNTDIISHREKLDAIYGEYLEDGYEGQMIRKNTVYEQNKRSKSLIKRKEFLTDEFPVVAVEEGKGNWSGHIKRFILALPGGTQFGAGVRGTQETMATMFESKEVPSWATLRYFTPTPDGIPRFPVVIDWGTGKRED